MPNLLIVEFYSTEDEEGSFWQMELPAVPRVGERCSFHAYVERGYDADKWDADLPTRVSGVVDRVEWAFEVRHISKAHALPFVNVYIRPDSEVTP